MFKKTFWLMLAVAMMLTLGVAEAADTPIIINGWTAPKQQPPSCQSDEGGCYTPLNVGNKFQSKGGPVDIEYDPGDASGGASPRIYGFRVLLGGAPGTFLVPQGSQQLASGASVFGANNATGGVGVAGWSGFAGLLGMNNSANGSAVMAKQEGTGYGFYQVGADATNLFEGDVCTLKGGSAAHPVCLSKGGGTGPTTTGDSFWALADGTTNQIKNTNTGRVQILSGLLARGADFSLADGGVLDQSAVRVFSNTGNLYLQSGAGNNILFRNKSTKVTTSLDAGGNLDAIGTISAYGDVCANVKGKKVCIIADKLGTPTSFQIPNLQAVSNQGADTTKTLTVGDVCTTVAGVKKCLSASALGTDIKVVKTPTLQEVTTAGASTDARVFFTRGGVKTNIFSSDAAGYVGTQSNHPLYLRVGDGNVMTLATSGNVGVGVSDPSYKLDVNGGIRAAGGLAAKGDGYFGGKLGIGTPTPTAELDVNGNIKAANINLSEDLYMTGNLKAANANLSGDLKATNANLSADLKAGGAIRWGNSELNPDQGGAIELRGTANNTPYIDFSTDGAADHSGRIIQVGDQMRVQSTWFCVNGDCSSDKSSPGTLCGLYNGAFVGNPPCKGHTPGCPDGYTLGLLGLGGMYTCIKN